MTASPGLARSLTAIAVFAAIAVVQFVWSSDSAFAGKLLSGQLGSLMYYLFPLTVIVIVIASGAVFFFRLKLSSLHRLVPLMVLALIVVDLVEYHAVDHSGHAYAESSGGLTGMSTGSSGGLIGMSAGSSSGHNLDLYVSSLSLLWKLKPDSILSYFAALTFLMLGLANLFPLPQCLRGASTVFGCMFLLFNAFIVM